MFKKILCPVDGSDHAEKALAMAIDLAKTSGSDLVIVHVLMVTAGSRELERFAEVEGLDHAVKPAIERLTALEARLDYGYDEQPQATRMFVEIGQKLLDDAKRNAEAAGVAAVQTILASGDPADQVLRCVARTGADCVIMGSRGLSDIRSLFLGSVSNKITNQAPCTCIAVR